METEKNSRMLELFFRVLRGETISVKAVAAEYGVSTKSIGRDIGKIQEFLAEHRDLMQQAELVYSYKDKAYHLNCEEFLKNKELFALVKVMLGSICGVEDRVPMFQQSRLPAEVVGSPEQCLYLCQQHVPVKGLGNKIVPAHVHCHN